MNSIEFVLDDSPAQGAGRLRVEITDLLEAGKKVLWLVSGGSNVQVCANVMEGLAEVADQNLAVMLMDERYGEAGHADSNWQQLKQAGFAFDKVRALPVLEQGLTREETAQAYARLAEREFAAADVVIALFGMGPDGHTSGILPNSPAATDEKIWAVDYDGGEHQRVTLSFFALAQIDVAYAFIFGANKKIALEQLMGEDLSLAEQPAQILKAIERVYVYNDQIGATI